MLTKTAHATRRPGPAPKRPDPTGSAQHAGALLRGLYEDHGPALLRLATGMTGGDRAGAEDLVQEAMLRAWRHHASTDFTAGSPRRWLATTIRRLAIDAYRARLARPPEAGPDALPVLAPHHREVVMQVYYRDRSIADTARALHIPPAPSSPASTTENSPCAAPWPPTMPPPSPPRHPPTLVSGPSQGRADHCRQQPAAAETQGSLAITVASLTGDEPEPCNRPVGRNRLGAANERTQNGGSFRTERVAPQPGDTHGSPDPRHRGPDGC